MDIPHPNPQPKICIKHNQPIVLIDPDPKKGAFCLFCIQSITGLISPNQLLNQQSELIDQSNQESKQNQQQLQNLLDGLLNYQQNINLSLNKIIQVIKNQIESIESFTKQILSQSMAIDELKQICQNQQKNNIQVRSEVQQQLKRFQTEYDNIGKLLNLFDDSQQKNILKNNSMKKFQYELIKDSSLKQCGYCFAFAFNKQGNKLLVACDKSIIVYEFRNGKMTKELQILDNHTNDILCLYFMKQSNTFVSGSRDNSIIIWDLDNNSSYQPKTYLKEHKSQVVCILMNKSEDLLISFSYDKTVFWIKIDNKWNLKQTIDAKQTVESISLNEYENKLISCGRNSPISIIQLQNDNKWSVIQTIQVCQYGCRLTFVKGNQFIFQPLTKDFIELYDFDEKQKQFQKLKEIKVQSCSDCIFLFPCQYLQQLNILTVKHGQFLNIFRINDEGENYQLEQTIKFQNFNLNGKLRDDGKYLATWDYGSKEIQIRKLKYLNEI